MFNSPSSPSPLLNYYFCANLSLVLPHNCVFSSCQGLLPQKLKHLQIEQSEWFHCTSVVSQYCIELYKKQGWHSLFSLGILFFPCFWLQMQTVNQPWLPCTLGAGTSSAASLRPLASPTVEGQSKGKDEGPPGGTPHFSQAQRHLNFLLLPIY